MIKNFSLSAPKILFFIILFAVLLRVFGLFDQFDIDEAWTFFRLAGLHSPWNIFTQLYENGHPLNSLFMYFIGKGNPAFWFKFRLLSCVFGILGVYLTYLISAKFFPKNEWRYISTVLVSSSFPLVFYSCSAMGYAAVIFFSLLSFLSLYEFIESARIKWLFIYYAAVFLGFLSHVIFVYVFIGLLGMSAYFYLLGPHKSRGKEKIISLTKIFLPPCFLFVFLYINFLSKTTFETGTTLSLMQIVAQLSAYLMGLPWQMPGLSLIAVIVYVILVSEMLFSMQEGKMFGIFSAVCFVTVFLEYLIRQPSFFYFRYFLSFYPFLILLFCLFLYRVVEENKKMTVAVLMIVLFMFGGNMVYNFSFIKKGRGHYWESLDYIAKSTKGPNVTISSNVQRLDLIMFYSLFCPGMKVAYVPYEKIEQFPPEWLIVYSMEDKPINETVLNFGNNRYEFKKSFFYAGNGLMGSNWFIYHKVEVTKKT